MPLTATPERIAQFEVSSTQTVSVHTISGARVVLRDINICRTDMDRNRTYVTLAIVPAGESFAAKHVITYQMVVRAGEAINLSDYHLVLHSGDEIYMSSTPGSVSVYLSGGKYVEV